MSQFNWVLHPQVTAVLSGCDQGVWCHQINMKVLLARRENKRFFLNLRLKIFHAEGGGSLSLLTESVINEKGDLRRNEGDGMKRGFSLWIYV